MKACYNSCYRAGVTAIEDASFKEAFYFLDFCYERKYRFPQVEEFDFLQQYSYVLYRIFDYDQSLEFAEKSLLVAENQDKSKVASVYEMISKIHIVDGRPLSGIDAANKGYFSA